MAHIKISACAIMKNEARHIGRWLDCVRQVADEIIVVDTGSTDETVALAEAGGARVLHFAWRDDFAAAKNFAIDQAGGKWILFLDADEYFPAACLPNVRLVVEETDPDIKVAGILCRWVNFDEDNGMALIGSDVQMRLFRNLRTLRYEGMIHEAITVPTRYKVLASDKLEIHHTGYSATLMKGKRERNRDLLMKKAAAQGGHLSLLDQRYLLDCEYDTGNQEEARKLAEGILAAPDRHEAMLSYVLAGVHRMYLSILFNQQAPRAEIEEAAARAEQDFPGVADFSLMLGSYYLDNGEEEMAREWLSRGLKLYERSCREGRANDLNVLSDNAETMVGRARIYLESITARRGLRISACAIMKDEERNLPAWLESVRAFADEIIVVDTGSTDRTKEIAKAGGAKVTEFPWCGDFAAAKNHAIEQATGEWVVFPDADETFAADCRSKIRPLLESLYGRSEIKAVACPLVNIDRDDHDRYMETIETIRVFRRWPELRYRGQVHESLGGLLEGNVHHEQGLTIYHTGYSSGQIRRKLERNLSLLQEKAEREGAVNPADYHYHMDCHYGLEHYKEAVAWARKVIDDPRQGQERWRDAWETYLSAMVRGHFPVEETLAALENGRKACPEMPRFTLMQGLYMYELHDYLRAEELLREGLTAPAGDKLSDTRRLRPHALAKLAELALLQGRVDEAQELVIRSVQENRYLPTNLQLLVRALRASSLDDAAVIELLSSLYRQEDAPFLARALWHTGGRLCLYYMRRSGALPDSVESFELAGQWGAAVEKLSQRLALEEKLALAQVLREGQELQEIPETAILPERLLETWQQLRQDGSEVKADKEQRAIRNFLRETVQA